MVDVIETNVANSISTDNDSDAEHLSVKVLEAFGALARERGMLDYTYETRPMSGIGENSYGLVLQVVLTPTGALPTDNQAMPMPFYCVLKISPKNPARRAHMRVAEYYKREVYMYETVFKEFEQLLHQHNELTNEILVNIAPEMLYSSLEPEDEFIIFEDLTQKKYTQNPRTTMPTYDLVLRAFQAVAKLHAMSFVLQAKKPHVFTALVSQMSDNLFRADMEAVSIEFGKSYVRRTRTLLEEERNRGAWVNSKQLINVLHKIEDNFKEICLHSTNGHACLPFAVICHGDFWNNNILYNYDSNNKATAAKLIDFQMSRYSSPVLDLVHYLFACTEKDLRDTHFHELLQQYYDTLSQHIRAFALDPEQLYGKEIFAQQLSEFGVYGFCMSAFAIPFFISNIHEIPNLDEVSEAIQDLSSSSDDNSDIEDAGKTNALESHQNSQAKSSNAEEHKCRELVDEYDWLNERTLPIFKRRMCGIVADLCTYDMIDKLLQL